MVKSKDVQMLSKRKGNVEITLVSTKYEQGKKPEYAEKYTYYEIQKIKWLGSKKEITGRISFSDEEEALKSYKTLISHFITKGESRTMSERTAFAVINKSGKVVEYTSRIPYQYGQVFYKGDIYQLKNPLPGMKAKKIIVLGTGYPVSNKKAIMKSPRKSKIIVPVSESKEDLEQAEREFQEELNKSRREIENMDEDNFFNEDEYKFQKELEESRGN